MHRATLATLSVAIVLVTMLVGAIYLITLAVDLPSGRIPGALGPRSFPLYVFVGIAVLSSVCAALEIRKSLRQRRSVKDGAASRATIAEEKVAIQPVLVLAAAVVAYAATWRIFGFVMATLAFTLLLSYVLAPADSRSLPRAAIVATVFTLAAWLLFVRLLAVPLPTGTIWRF